MGRRRGEFAAHLDIAIRPIAACVPVPSGVPWSNLVCHQGPGPVIAVVILDSIYGGATDVPPVSVTAHVVPLLDRHHEWRKVRPGEEWRKKLHSPDGDGKHGQGGQRAGPSPQ